MYIASLMMINGVNEMDIMFIYGKQYLSENKARAIVNIIKQKLISIANCNIIKSKL